MAETSQGKQKLPVNNDWYQTESTVVITVMVKNVKQEYLTVNFYENQVEVSINNPDYAECDLSFNLLHKIIPTECSYKLSSTKVEIKLKKLEGLRWEKLEKNSADLLIKNVPSGDLNLNQPPSYPTSKIGKDWSAVEKDIKEQEAREKPEGEDAINKLFQEIYGKGSDEVKRAMNKSYMESGGTVLSTNWEEISKKKVDVKPPDGMEFKKWNN